MVMIDLSLLEEAEEEDIGIGIKRIIARQETTVEAAVEVAAVSDGGVDRPTMGVRLAGM